MHIRACLNLVFIPSYVFLSMFIVTPRDLNLLVPSICRSSIVRFCTCALSVDRYTSIYLLKINIKNLLNSRNVHIYKFRKYTERQHYFLFSFLYSTSWFRNQNYVTYKCIQFNITAPEEENSIFYVQLK